MVVAILAGVFLPLTHYIDFQERIGPILPGEVWVRLADVVFRMLTGALLVFVLTPVVFGYRRGLGGLRRYVTHIRVSLGSSPRKTAVVTLLALGAMMTIMALVPLAMGEFRADPAALIRDDQWTILLFAVPIIWEELAFRGAILANVEDGASPRRALVVSTVLFGLFHVTNLWVWDDPESVFFGMVAATTLGVGWGYLVIRSGSVLTGFVLHYSVNLSLASELFTDPGASEEVFGATFLVLAVLWPVLMIAIGRRVFGPTPGRHAAPAETGRLEPAATHRSRYGLAVGAGSHRFSGEQEPVELGSRRTTT